MEQKIKTYVKKIGENDKSLSLGFIEANKYTITMEKDNADMIPENSGQPINSFCFFINCKFGS